MADNLLSSERCNRCRFWSEDMTTRDPADENFGFGHCRRSPPVMIPQIAAMQIQPPSHRQQTDLELDITAAHTASRFPATFSADWCGEYEPIGGWSMPC